MSSMHRLTVVVGASRGIGRHLTMRAAARGDSVIGCARDADVLGGVIADLPHATTVEVVAADFLSGDAPLEAVGVRVVGHAGPVTVVVCAATMGPVGRLTHIDLDLWAAALEANVVGTARILARLIPHLRAEDLVVVFSGGGVGGPSPQPNVSAYTTSKVALTHLVEVVARENPGGPIVVAIAPGAFPTEFTRPVVETGAELAGDALMTDVLRTRGLPFDAADLDGLLDHLEATPRRALSGRTLSAKRDRPAALETMAPDDPDLLRLRRVDGHSIVARTW